MALGGLHPPAVPSWMNKGTVWMTTEALPGRTPVTPCSAVTSTVNKSVRPGKRRDRRSTSWKCCFWGSGNGRRLRPDLGAAAKVTRDQCRGTGSGRSSPTSARAHLSNHIPQTMGDTGRLSGSSRGVIQGTGCSPLNEPLDVSMAKPTKSNVPPGR